ncbi:MAG: exopolyphosphatase [Rickettsiales bacterium]|jgi:exopolyphosphatase/guanosine-5'-triphosphate,3'-diphosphate pyrophosphatase|nr:exopolyphosphatase [Rickettsiales bacterium]
MSGVLGCKKAGQNKGHVAIIDIGSNSVRLVVYEGAKRAPLPIFNEKVICALGRDLDRDGCMSKESMDLAVDGLHRFVALIESMGVPRVYTVATAAVREASNGTAFVERVVKDCGLEVNVVSGSREAELSGLGVISAIPKAQGFMGDLGGGSIELVKLGGGHLHQKATLPLGVLRSANGNLTDAAIDSQLSNLGWLNLSEKETFYAVGGAWRALARIHMEQANYPLHVIHQYSINAMEAVSFLRLVGNLSRVTLSGIQGLNHQRIDSVPYAARLLERLIFKTSVDRLVFCAYGVREGCLFDRLSQKRRSHDPLIAMSQEVAVRAGRMTSDGDSLANWISPVFENAVPDMARLRLAASHLADIGWSEHPDYRAEQVFLRILRMPLIGLDHCERSMLALSVASRHSRIDKIVRRWRMDELLNKKRIAEARSIGLAMRLAYTLTGGSIGILNSIRLEYCSDNVRLLIPTYAKILVGDVVERRLRALAKSLKCTYEIVFFEEESPHVALI